MNSVGGFPTPGFTPGYNPVYGPGYGPSDDDGMNRDPMMQRPGGDYIGPDAEGNYPDVEEPIMATKAEEQELKLPRMFRDPTHQRSSLYENEANYQDTFARRVSQLEGDTFLDAVRTNDIEWVEGAFKSKDITSPVRNEDRRRLALEVAIKKRHIDMVKLLLDNDAPIGNAFFRAVDVSSTPVVRVLCEHLKGKGAILDSALNSFSEDAEFSFITTPLMMAACANEHDIVKLLIAAGARMPSLEAILARVANSYDIYERALARLHWHTAMCSEAYLLFSSDDPIKAAFEAGLIIEETVKDQPSHIKPKYKDLRQNLDTFLTKYLDVTHSSIEIASLLSEQKSDERFEIKTLPRRLIYALDLKFKGFVANNNCQQYVLDRWYLYHQEWEELPTSHFCLRTALIFILMPVLCVIYILFPVKVVKRFMKMPFVRFVLQMASRIFFLIFLIYSTVSSSTDQKIAKEGENDELGPTKSPEENNAARVEHYLEYRGCPAHFVIWLIYVWIAGMTWREVKELWRQGFKEYLSELFNWVDIIQLGLYWIAIILNFVSYYMALNRVRTAAWETWDSCAAEEKVKDDSLGSQLGEIEEPKEVAKSVHAKFECETRTDWSPYDPLLISEGCFALATVLTFLGALRDTVILSFVGPLRISLGGMIIDIVRFFVLFFFLWISFAIGLTQLYETFMVLKTFECEEGEDCHPAFLTFYSTLGTLFWSLFDLADIEELEVHPTAGMVFTEGVGLFLYAAYLVIAVVVMLNALIAMMSNTYTRVEENTDVEWKVERTKLMVDYMVNCPTLPAPFNLVPTPKSIMKICRRLYKCCFMRKSMKRKKMDEARDRSEREDKYKTFIQTLTGRYIGSLKTEQLDDESERLQMDLSSMKELLRVMRNQMRAMREDNLVLNKNVDNCMRNMNDMLDRQKKLEEQQRKQLNLLIRGSRPPSGIPTPPPVSSPPPQRPDEEEIQANMAHLEEAERNMHNLTQALEELPWIDSEV